MSLKRDGSDITFWDDEPDAVQTFLADHKLPFTVAESHGPWLDETGRSYSSRSYACPKLQPNGRCGDYENRPDLCRSFEPGSDRLCAHYRGAEAGDPTVSLDLAHI